ncbi:MAG: zinc-ribbon and DUF3426 domain-containing protein [Gammaproteobacteria bacterium]
MKLSSIFGKLLSAFTQKRLAKDYIRCPHCTTLYALYTNVDWNNLAIVHCGTCANTFNGMENKSRPRSKIKIPKKINPFQPRLSWLKASNTPKPHAPHMDETPAKAEKIEEAIPYVPILLAEIATPEEIIIPEFCEDPIIADKIESQFDNVKPAATEAKSIPKSTVKEFRQWGWLLTTLGFLLVANLLIGGFFWTQRNTLAQNALLRPWLITACDYLGCTLPEYRDPSKIIVQQNQLTSDPNNPDHFQLHAVIQNTAPYAQPLARLQMNIKNLQGEKVNSLIFLPQQYAPNQPNLLLPPGETLHIIVSIMDKTPDIFSYDLNFL